MSVSRLVDWTSTTLGECADWYSGGTPDTSNPEYWNGDIPWITASSLHNFYVWDSERRVTELGLLNGTRLMPANTIIFVVRGMSLKSEFRVGIARRPVAFGQDCKAIIPHKNMEPLFLANVLRAKQNEILSLVSEASHGTGRLETDAIKKLTVLVPRLAEQRAIFHILGAMDDKIDLNRKMNETLEAIARALFKSWFVDFDPVRAKAEGRQSVGMDAETAALFPDGFEDSELGEIPRGWKVNTIGDQVRVVGGTTPSTKEPKYWSGGAINWATPNDLASPSSSVLIDTGRRITDLGLKQISSGLLPPGTVLLSSRAPIGYLAISEVPVAVNQGFIAMICDRELPNHYVLQWAHTNMETIEARANGTTFLEITKANFRPIPVLVPSKPILQFFSNQAHILHKRIVNNLKEANTLAALRDALLPKLISGQVRVPVETQTSEVLETSEV